MKDTLGIGEDQNHPDFTLNQTCGYQLLSMYDTGDYKKVGTGQTTAGGNDDCRNWTENLEKSGFVEGGVGVLCNFRRPFDAESQQQLEDGQTLDIIAGFNIYNSDSADYRLAYGYSIDSLYREMSWQLTGASVTVLTLAAASIALLVTF